MSEEPALYVRDGAGVVGTPLTAGAWDPGAQSGGAVLALLGHLLEEVPTLTPMSLARLTVDLVSVVPVGRRLSVDTSVVREGKMVQIVDFTMTSLSGEHVRARALRVRDADLGGGSGLPASTTESDPAAALPAPDEMLNLDDHPGIAEFLRSATEFRRATAPIDGRHGLRVRLRVPVVAGEPVRPTSRATLPMDLVNLIGVHFDPVEVTAINPDVSGHVFRPPVGEWIALMGDTRFSYGVGHGVSMATMSDALGVFGVTSTSQLLDRRSA